WDEEISGEPEEGSLSVSEHVLGTEDVSIIDDDGPPQEEGAEKTRIEMNPLEQVLAMEAERKDKQASMPTGPARPSAKGAGNGAGGAQPGRFPSASTPVPLPAPPT